MTSLLALAVPFFSGRLTEDKEYIELIGSNSIKFYIIFSLSLLTGSLGMTKFWKTGPLKFLPSRGPVKGFLTVQFILTLFTTVFFLAWKLFNVFIMMTMTGFILPILFNPQDSSI